MIKSFGNGGSQFNQFDLNNMMGRMLGHSMRVSGVDSDGDGVRQAMSGPTYKTAEEADAAIAVKRAEYKAKHDAAMNTPEAKQSTANYYASMTPANRKIYEMMSRY
jgi:hypothetical protein